MSAKLLEKMNGPREMGCLELDGINLKLYGDTWEFPRCLHVVENNKLLAKIRIPDSEPNSLDIISGNLTSEQYRDTLTILKDDSFGIPGWETAYVCMIEGC